MSAAGLKEGNEVSHRMSARAAIAVVAACATLFGASYAGAKLTGDDGGGSAQSTTPVQQPTPAPQGRSLKLAGAAGLPGLRKPPKPKPEPATASAPAVVAAPAPAPRYSAPPAPSKSDGNGGTPAPKQNTQPAPENTAKQPTVDFDDSG
jgi:hypothetical protein